VNDMLFGVTLLMDLNLGLADHEPLRSLLLLAAPARQHGWFWTTDPERTGLPISVRVFASRRKQHFRVVTLQNRLSFALFRVDAKGASLRIRTPWDKTGGVFPYAKKKPGGWVW
jgi:hypothetical protein